MQVTNVFDLIKCGVCGVPWPEHSDRCPNHVHRDEARGRLRDLMSVPAWGPIEQMLRVNGWDGPDAGLPDNGANLLARIIGSIFA